MTSNYKKQFYLKKKKKWIGTYQKFGFSYLNTYSIPIRIMIYD